MSNAPDYTITANPHAFIHCGPVTHEGIDDKRDLTIITSANNSIIHSKSGNKNERIQGFSAEVVAINGDPSQHGGVAKAIIAKTGDIVLNAENGDVYINARNIFFNASGESGHGNIMSKCNGFYQVTTGSEYRLAAARMCIVSEGNMNFVGDMMLAGNFNKGSAVSSAGFLKSILSGNWASLITAISQTCK
jgi:hypothetical protein